MPMTHRSSRVSRFSDCAFTGGCSRCWRRNCRPKLPPMSSGMPNTKGQSANGLKSPACNRWSISVRLLPHRRSKRGSAARRTVRNALLQAFEDNGSFDPDQLPKECVITDRIPYNATGKVDVNLITKGYVEGKTYTVESVCRDGKLINVIFDQKQEETGYSGMGCDQFFG